MPNHVMNILTIKGSKERVREILEEIKDEEVGYGSIDFNKIEPMPKELNRVRLGNERRVKALQGFCVRVYGFCKTNEGRASEYTGRERRDISESKERYRQRRMGTRTAGIQERA